MQKPTPRTSVSKCVALGLYTPAMLANFPQNPALAALVASLTGATNALAAAQKAYADAVIALIPKRVAVKLADHVSDKAVRALLRRAEIADDKKNGKIATALFPGGVTPIVRPAGDTQVTEMRSLEGRLEAAESIWSAALAEKAKITAERTKYEAALTARRTAMEAVADLRAKRDAAKEDFLDVYSSTADRVKAEFPRDRPTQDLFFDKVSDAPVADDEDDTDDSAPPAGELPAAPAPAPA